MSGMIPKIEYFDFLMPLKTIQMKMKLYRIIPGLRLCLAPILFEQT